MHNVTINNLLPGSFDTDRLQGMMKARAAAQGKSVDDVMAGARASIPAGRFGNPAEFGLLCAYVCGANAGFLVGQNLLIDGGSYAGTF